MSPAGRRRAGPEWTPAEPARRPVLLVNPTSGDGKAVRLRLADLARGRGIETLVLEAGQQIADLAAEAVRRGADVLGVAGGDGSLATAAAVARRHDLPFVCVPAGTRNHFALDLGVVRRDPVGALDAFSAGVERRVDVAEVNGRPFLNNVSLGIYADAVHREGYRDAKLRALLEAAERVLGPAVSAPAPALRLADDTGQIHTRPAVVLVSNNPYAAGRAYARGTRPRLDGGRLGVVVLDGRGERRNGGPRAWSADTIEIDAAEPVRAGLDGEAVTLGPPLRFAIHPRALRVRISARHPGTSPSAPRRRA